MIKILEKNFSIENIENNIECKCSECGGDLIVNSFEKTCMKCGLVIDEVFRDSSYMFCEETKKNNWNKQYVALGNRTDFVGGLGSFIGYENSKYLRDKDGKLLSPNEQKKFRRLKKNYALFLRIKDHETEYRIFNILSKICSYLDLNKNIQNMAAYF